MRFQMSEYSQRILTNKVRASIRGQNEFAPVLFS